MPVLVRLGDVEPKPIHWLWFNRIPFGMLTLLVGDGGLGKSFLSLYMASRISTGAPWPDSSGLPDDTAPMGSTILLTAEDDLSYVVRPRLDAMSANANKIIAFEAVKNQSGQNFFNMQQDLPALKNAIQSLPDTRLVIIDPLSSYLGGKIDSHRDSDVRGVLMPLVQLAEETHIAILGIMHLNKAVGLKAVYRAIGSVAFAACARTVWLVTADPQEPNNGRRLFLPAKHNVLINPTGLAFSIDDGRVLFENGFVTTTADDALSGPKIDSPKLKKAKKWLENQLSSGAIASTELSTLAKENGITESTLRRAKDSLDVISYPFAIEDKQIWFVKLPDDSQDKDYTQQYSSIDNYEQVALSG